MIVSRMKNNITIALLCVIIVAMMGSCKKKTIDFSYSPAAPRAGQTVRFSNLSDTGEDWAWTFGDGATSASKSPNKVYRQPGKYTVILKVDDKASQTVAHELTVYDTIPNFTSSIDSTGLRVFEDVTFKALVYNPFGYALDYRWKVVDEVPYVAVSESDSLANYTLYFQRPGTVTMQLRVILGTDTTVIRHQVEVQDKVAEGVLMQDKTQSYRQRIYGVRADSPRPTSDASCLALLAAAQDTIAVLNDSIIRLSDLEIPGMEWDGFCLVNFKYYLRSLTDGLWVVNMDGSYPEQVCEEPVYAVMADVVDNRVYWAAADSVMYMPLVGPHNNKYDKSKHKKLSDLSGVVRLAKDTNQQ